MKKIAVLNGPNLDRLGKREPELYGRASLEDLAQDLRSTVSADAVELQFFQSNHEGELIDTIGRLAEAGVDGVIINPGGLTHTSVALRDALVGSGLRVIEVHISNIYRREEFRHKSLTAPACVGVVTGLGLRGYRAALDFLLQA